MSLTTLFWNAGGKNEVAEALAALTAEYAVQLVILAESRHVERKLIVQLLQATGRRFREQETGCPRLRLFIDPESMKIRSLASNAYAAFFEVHANQQLPILIAAAHLPSKLHHPPEDQREIARRNLADQIAHLEEALGYERTVLVGDLNMDPFEPAVVSAGNLHATFSRKTASCEFRTVRRHQYRFFYNPMWRFYATIDEKPGTYHRTDSTWTAYFWHMYDQVLVRPSLLPAFPSGEPLIVDRAGDFSLLTETGRPDRRRYSDHLPLVFRLDLAAIGS